MIQAKRTQLYDTEKREGASLFQKKNLLLLPHDMQIGIIGTITICVLLEYQQKPILAYQRSSSNIHFPEK